MGWIGRNRLEAIARSGISKIAVIDDCSHCLAIEAARIEPCILIGACSDTLLRWNSTGL